MSMEAAFLGPLADDLFSSVAAFGDASELAMLDVAEGQTKAREAIKRAIANALMHRKNPGSRVSLIKGDAGSGKSHVLTATFKKAAGLDRGEVYPAVLQMTSPVKTEDYEVWLLDAIVRELTARHFADERRQSPMRRLATDLLRLMPLSEQDEFFRLIGDPDDNGEVALARKFALRIRLNAVERLGEDVPPESFLSVVLLAGFGDSSALAYLRTGVIEPRLEELHLEAVGNPHQRLDVLRRLGLTAQIVGAALALGFDQVENTIRLGSEGLFVHTLTQAVRIAEAIPNAAIIIVVLGTEYDEIVAGNRSAIGLAVSDRDRIEREPPLPVALTLGSAEFLLQVVARRLAVLRERARLKGALSTLEPLPDWHIPRITGARSVRLALREVALLREDAIERGRLPTEAEYLGTGRAETIPSVAGADLDKEWADHLDLAPFTNQRLLDPTKADLLAWWAVEASRESMASLPLEVVRDAMPDDFSTPILEIVFTSGGVPIEKRQLALCEAPNRHNRLRDQIERFIESATAIPAVLRTNGFPKGKTSQIASALRKVGALNGLVLDLSETEWSNLRHAKDFADRMADVAGFLEWRRDRQWLTKLLSPLQPLISPPRPLMEPVNETDADVRTAACDPAPILSEHPEAAAAPAGDTVRPDGPFPVLIGRSFDGDDVHWAPEREAPNHLNNFGFLVTGDAGSGKTQTIRVLIDAACQARHTVTIFDFKADYCDPTFVEPLGIEVIDVRATGLPFNPLQPPPRGASGVQPVEHAYELAAVLGRVFKLGPVQVGKLREAILAVYGAAGIEPREWVDPTAVSWPTFDLVLGELRDQKGSAALVTKLDQLVDLGLFPSGGNSGGSFESFIDRRVSLKLSDLPTDQVKSAIAEIIIIQLHGYALRGAQPRRLKRLMVFDEAHRVKDSQRLESLAREGRAFGIGIVIGTQFPGDIPETMAGNLATQLFLMNNQAAHRRFVVQQLRGSVSGGDGKSLLDRLGRLKPLEGVLTNAHYGEGTFVRVVPHWKRAEREKANA